MRRWMMIYAAVSLLQGCSTMTYSAPSVEGLKAQVEASPPKQQHPCLSWELRGDDQAPFSKSLYVLDERGRLVRESVRYFGEGILYTVDANQKPKRVNAYNRALEYGAQDEVISLNEQWFGVSMAVTMAVTTFTYDDARRLILREQRDIKGSIIARHTTAYDAQARPTVERVNPDDQGQARQIIVHQHPDQEPVSLDGLVADQILIHRYREDGKLVEILSAQPRQQQLALFIYGDGDELLSEVRPQVEHRFTYDAQRRLKTREALREAQIIEHVAYYYDQTGHLIWSHAQDLAGRSSWRFNDYRCEKPEVKP